MLVVTGSLLDGRNDSMIPGLVMTMTLELVRHKPGMYFKSIEFGKITEQDGYGFTAEFKSVIGSGKSFENQNDLTLLGTVELIDARDEPASESAVYLNLN